MYPNPAQVNQYNSYQYNNNNNRPQQPQYNQQQQQQQLAPILPPRPVNPHDQTASVISKLKIQYNGINPTTTQPIQEKVRLTSSSSERVPIERKADLYAILVGLEHVEGAFVRGSLTASQYTTSCNRFLSQYKTWMDIHNALITSLESFVLEAGLNVPAAMNRIKAGLPATSVHGGHDTSLDAGLATVDLAEKFITTFDIARVALSMETPQLEVENIFSYLSDLLDSLVKYPNLPPDSQIKTKVQHWVQFCSSKPNCYYQFSMEELKQLAFDLENSYSNFRKFVGNSKP